jgi:hypothetical protein
VRSLRASESLGGETGYAVSHPRQIALETRAVRGVESDCSEYDHGPAGHPQGKHIIDRRDLRFYVPEGRFGGSREGVGTARHLAVAARTRQRLLWRRAGFAGTRPSLAGTAIE